MQSDLIDLTCELVSIESENPPGNERACSEYIVDWFEKNGIEAELIHEPYPDRPQAVAQVGCGEPVVVLNGHVDVVPAGDHSNWTHNPYDPIIEDGRIYGRGTTDMKSCVALGMIAARELKPDLESDHLDGSVIVHAAVGEERGEPGTKTLLELGYDGSYGIVLEPTGFRVATSQKGSAWIEFTIHGDPAHASRPYEGRNAAKQARHLIELLTDYNDKLKKKEEPMVGPPFATITGINGGTKENVVPESTTITIDRRVIPAETRADIETELDRIVNKAQSEFGINLTWNIKELLESSMTDPTAKSAQIFLDHSHDVLGTPLEPWGDDAASDVRNFINDADMEAITWGPSNTSRAHIIDEYIEIKELEKAFEVLDPALRELLSEG